MMTTGFPSTKQNILQHLLKQGQATAQQLARDLKISKQAVRRHLNELEAEGLITYQLVQQKMGRPQHLYQLSDRGRDRLSPQKYGEFAVSFLDTLAETVGKEQVSKVLEKQWKRKAAEYRDRLGQGTLAQRIAKLVELRKEEGYMAELHQVSTTEEEQFILVEYNCAIYDVAESYPSICGHELEMFAAVLPDCNVQRTHWINDGEHQCGYCITRNEEERTRNEEKEA
ncbi:MAG: iron-sulfur cluster biosynthesis transcriptional regulator SufR [Pleurocapsa sp. MO_226.B13]|nr:iron-sulfur cluster biosynthesis transcriptional regulator SufR [Pleurocapsa sp. MO_226.B13]